jgi:hypothetical protein
MLLKISRCGAQLVEGCLAGRISQVCIPGVTSQHPQSPELPCALSMEGAAVVSGNILNVSLELIPPDCPASSWADRAGHHEGLNLS